VTIEELYGIGEEFRNKLGTFRAEIQVCGGGGCLAAGADDLLKNFDSACRQHGLENKVRVVATGCMGLCGAGPLVRVTLNDVMYTRVTPDDVAGIVEDYSRKLKRYKERLLPGDFAFYGKQSPVVLEHMGHIDPWSIEDYIAHSGYEALAKSVTYHNPESVILEIRNSGLRGRGGGGYPTGLKWDIVRRGPAGNKYIVCNADEGDPGSFMDRAMLQGNPHSILEGMAIAGYAVGAQQGYIYVRGEYTRAIECMRHAIEEAERMRLLGNRIFESGFNFHVDLRVGAGAFVCGEETALLRSIEGLRGQPRPRPPFPSQSGLWGKPTVVNNVETIVNVAPIVLRGARWFSGLGTKGSTGTKVIALTGRVNNTGLVEVPMGTTLRTIVEDIGGGIVNDGICKAVQSGGPSGGCIPAKHLDVSYDFDSLSSVGSMMGSGGLVVMDDTTCMVDMACYFMDFCRSESCGKCIPCRVGTVQMHRLLDKIRRGSARESDIETLEELCVMIKDTSLCGLGQSSPNPVISILHYFRKEVEQHVFEHSCPAGVCSFEDADPASIAPPTSSEDIIHA